MDGCATLYNDPQVQPQLKALAEKLHWAPSLIQVQPAEDATPAELPATAAPVASKPLEVKADQPVEFLGPVDGKLLRGVDGNVYAVDFIRSQPVDTYWIQEQLKRTSQNTSQAILRPELVEQFMARRLESEQQAKTIRELLAAKEKGEKIEGLTEEQIETLKKQVEIIEKSGKGEIEVIVCLEMAWKYVYYVHLSVSFLTHSFIYPFIFLSIFYG